MWYLILRCLQESTQCSRGVPILLTFVGAVKSWSRYIKREDRLQKDSTSLKRSTLSLPIMLLTTIGTAVALLSPLLVSAHTHNTTTINSRVTPGASISYKQVLPSSSLCDALLTTYRHISAKQLPVSAPMPAISTFPALPCTASTVPIMPTQACSSGTSKPAINHTTLRCLSF